MEHFFEYWENGEGQKYSRTEDEIITRLEFMIEDYTINNGMMVPLGERQLPF